MNLPKLSDECLPLPTHTLSFCQLCGTEYADRCEIRLWTEYEDHNQGIGPGSKTIVVGQKCCQQKIDDHPRGYLMVQWGRGTPGMFSLVCGDCKHRRDLKCTNPQAEMHGGPGIEVILYDPLGGASVHIYGRGRVDMAVVESCSGHEVEAAP